MQQCSLNSFRCLNISHRKFLYCAITRIPLLTACAQVPLINAHPDVFKEARGLYFGLSLHLHPYFMYASSEGSGESAHMRRLAWAFAARWRDKYRKLVHWPMFSFSRLIRYLQCNGTVPSRASCVWLTAAESTISPTTLSVHLLPNKVAAENFIAKHTLPLLESCYLLYEFYVELSARAVKLCLFIIFAEFLSMAASSLIWAATREIFRVVRLK